MLISYINKLYKISNINKLETSPVNLSKLSILVKNDVVKKTTHFFLKKIIFFFFLPEPQSS